MAGRWGIPVGLTAFNPLTQVSALHAVWLSDPSWTNPGDGNAISSLRNQSGGGDPAQATGTKQPIYRASVAGLNNRPAAQFDGSNDDLLTTISSVSAPYKMLMVAMFSSTPAAANTWLGTSSATNTQGLVVSSGIKWQFHNGTGVQSTTNVDATAHVHRVTFDTSGQYWLDEVSIVIGNVGSGSITTWALGAAGSGASRFAAIYIAFAAIYAGSTLDSDLSALAAGLKNYYATP